MYNGVYVPGQGCPSARLLVVGEAPGKHEEQLGFPFAGPSGKILRRILQEEGMDPSECYYTNVVKIRPPNNEIQRLHQTGHSIDDFTPELWNEIQAINPNCILAVGGTALQTLTGKKGIEHYRGSILEATLTRHKIVSCLHPASLLHEGDTAGKLTSWKEIQYIKADIRRAIQESETPVIDIPYRQLDIARNSLDLIRFLERNQKNEMACIDTETFKTYPICIGIAFDEVNALSIPLFNFGIKNEAFPELPMSDRVYTWKHLAEFLADTKIKIIAQNAKFDEKRLRQIGMDVHDIWFDTGMAWHVLFCELGKKLEIMTSILTKEPYYKDEGKEFNPKRDRIDRLMLYNARDAVVTYECATKLIELLKEEDLYDFYFERIHPLHRLYSDIEDVGLLVDATIRKELHDKYQALRDEKKKALIELIKQTTETDEFGVINSRTKKPKTIKIDDFNCDSPEQVSGLVYGLLHCPLRADTGEDTLKALANNAVKDGRIKQVLFGILEDRKIGKSIGTYLEAEPSEDGRIHTQYNINGAESGRTSTSILRPPVSIKKEGIALQTMTKHEDVTLGAGGSDLRRMFIADEGYTFLEADLSMAEDRVVCVLARDFDAFNELNRKKFTRNKHNIKDDRHTKTAMAVCGMDFESTTDYYRQIGKRVRHAGNYNMGKHTGMITLAKYGIFVSEWRMGQMLEKFHAANPRIRGVFHQEIAEALEANACTLYNPFGRKRIFFNKYPSEEILKEAYAQIPQSTVSDQVKFAMLRIRKRIEPPLFYFAQESHDSFLALVRNDYLEPACVIVREELERPINFSRCTLSRDYDLIIPCDLKVGTCWGELNELALAISRANK